jgi:hypothetical protein
MPKYLVHFFPFFEKTLSQNQCCGSVSGSGPFWSDPDPDVWDRIRILALINDPISTFLVCVKAINTLGLPFGKLFGS